MYSAAILKIENLYKALYGGHKVQYGCFTLGVYATLV